MSTHSAESAAGDGEKRPQGLDNQPLSSRSSNGSSNPTGAKTMPQVEQEAGVDVEAVKGEKPVPGPMDPSSYPDGGREAWLVVLGGFCCLFCSFGFINCIGVFQDYYQRELLSDLSPSTIAWISSLETFMMFFCGPFIGKLLDNYGPHYILLSGSVLEIFGIFMTSISTKYYQFILAQGILTAFGASAIFYCAMSTLSSWFFHRRALAFGIIASGSSLGGVVLPIMLQRLIPKIGFGWAMRLLAFLFLALLLIANLTVKSRLAPTPKPFRFADFTQPLRELPFALVTGASFLFFFGLFLPFTYIIVQAIHNGMDIELAGYLVAILNATSILGRLVPAYLADKYGRFNVMIIMTFFTSSVVLALWLPASSNAALIVFAALYGVGSGAFVSMQPALVAQISDIRMIGVRNGTLFAIISLAALAGSPIGGQLVLLDGGGFRSLQIFCGVVMMAGSFGFVLARIKLAGLKIAVKV
ncbi:MAG: hypothetical protein M1829_004798 [Trizodia sp. TS-e1964]|nr:MAG: hypothetical protein M1829_004798 [Trizodia sp. TS-e1964]